MSDKIIQQLASIAGLKVQCPHCTEEFPITRAKVCSMYDPHPLAEKMIRERQGVADELNVDLKQRKKLFFLNKQARPERITTAALACNFGQISEQILPAFLTFPYKRNECRILFKPVDYIVFGNLSRQGQVDTIKFVDVKTGNGRLDKRQRQIRDRICEGNVKHRIID